MGKRNEFAVAVVARNRHLASIGVDLEPRLPLSEELLGFVATSAERRRMPNTLLAARLLFCAKEAVFKATHPLDGLFLEHHDIEVEFDGMTARTRSGHRLRLHLATAPRLVALTALPNVATI